VPIITHNSWKSKQKKTSPQMIRTASVSNLENMDTSNPMADKRKASKAGVMNASAAIICEARFQRGRRAVLLHGVVSVLVNQDLRLVTVTTRINSVN